MKSVRAPRFLENLYRDMRDRRLLLPAAALLVAVIAVPLLLGSSSSSTPVAASPPASGSASAGSATDPAVLAEQAGVTDYRKRLDSLQSKDPFTARGPAAPKPSSGGSGGSSSSSSSSSTTGSTLGSSVSADSTVSVSGATGSTGSSTTTVGSTTGSTSGSSNSNSNTAPKPRYYAFRVSVAVGPAGNLSQRNSVKRLVFLPGDNRPLVAFVGVSEDTKRAVFSVSHDVSAVRGDGKCLPKRSTCTYLELKPGDKASLDYAPQHDRRFNLKLREIKVVQVAKPQAAGAGKVGSVPILGPDG
ncbi:MAG: hypothetical protein ACRDK1_02110 [Solirubrobacterales bacterium]